MKLSKLCLAFLFSAFLFYEGVAQTKQNVFTSDPEGSVKSSCNENNSALGILNQYTPKDQLIIVVSHLGAGEDEKFNNRRLHNARFFFERSNIKESQRSTESILTTTGERTNDTGRLDFYVKGVLEIRILFDKNQDLSLPPCVLMLEEKPCSTKFENSFYPCLDKKK